MMGKLLRKLFPSKEIREYNRMYRRHRRELVKLAKETREWDYCWFYRSIIMQINHMYEYYSNGNNVWQTDETRLPIVEELKHVLDCDAEIERLENEHFGLDWVDNGGKLEFIYPEGREAYNTKVYAKEKRINELHEEIFNSIGKNFRGWWD